MENKQPTKEEIELKRLSDEEITEALAQKWNVDVKDVEPKAIFRWFYIIADKQYQSDLIPFNKLKAELEAVINANHAYQKSEREWLKTFGNLNAEITQLKAELALLKGE